MKLKSVAVHSHKHTRIPIAVALASSDNLHGDQQGGRVPGFFALTCRLRPGLVSRHMQALPAVSRSYQAESLRAHYSSGLRSLPRTV